MTELDGQVAIVAGGAGGIGRAVARRFLNAGARVAVLDVCAESAAEAVRDLGEGAVALVADVADRAGVNAAVAGVVNKWGRLDIAVSSAGVARLQPFLEIDDENWNRHLDVHLTGTLRLGQAAGRVMARAGYGRIINISSVAALMSGPDLAAYSAVKAAVLGLTRAAAVDLAPLGITVNAIAPGPVETELIKNWGAEGLATRASHLPIDRLGMPEEIARAALFLAAPEASWITGTVLVVDGGSAAAGSYMVEVNRRRTAAGK